MKGVLPSQGTRAVVLWEPNGEGGVKANKLGDDRTEKIILPFVATDGPPLRPGQKWLCEVVKVTKPNSVKRGAIVVKPVRQHLDCAFQGIWIEPGHQQVIAAVLPNPKKNLMLLGPEGCGKTTISKAFADHLDWQFRKIECSQIQKYSHLYGRMQQTLIHGQLGWVWIDSPLPTYIKEARDNPDRTFLIMLDEYTRMEKDAQNVLLPVIEGTNRLLQTPKPESIEVPSNIHWMAGGNIGDGFNVQEQDNANMDRWIVIKLGYMPYDQELQHCLRKFEGCPRDKLEKALKVIHSLRKIVSAKLRMSKAVSTRMAENTALLLSEGIDIQLAMTTAVANQYSGWEPDVTSQCARIVGNIKDALAGKNIEAA